MIKVSIKNGKNLSKKERYIFAKESVKEFDRILVKLEKKR